MPKLNKIVAFLDEFLGTDDVDDSSWNVLQFEGKSIVKRAAFAVDAGIDAFKMSADVKADILIVHHGHFWDFRNPSITGWAKERIKILFENDISLYVSHNPLDRHKEVGHNAQILKLLGARITDEFFSLSREKHRLDGRVPECVSVEKNCGKAQPGVKNRMLGAPIREG